ncbi:MAG: hypothetical protein WC418_01235 [Candidatus Omnitrophota bacterium]|jgi:hypothetical protein
MNKRKLLSLLTAGMFFPILTSSARGEDMTVTTYYPSPNGSYDALSVKRFSVGDTNGDGNINASDVAVSNGYLLVADKIGIRTTSPDAALKIESGGMAIGQAAAISDADGNNRSIQITTDTSYGGTYNDHTGALIFSIMPGGWGTSELHFRNSNNWSSYRSEDSMIISYDTTYIHGNVGIGTVSPGAKLHLCGGDGSVTFASAIIALGYSTTGQYPHFIHTRHNSGAGTGNAIDFYTGDQTAAGVFPTNAVHGMTIENGRVGIGTTSPGTLVHTYGNGGWNAGFRTEYSGGSGNGWNIVDGTDNNLYIGYGSSSAPSAKVVLQNGGNVGIGTTTPNANMKLQAAGEICSSTLGAAGGNIRMIAGNYGCFIRNDGANTYFLLTNAGDQYGGWNGLRPLYINDASGYVTFGNGHGDLAENYLISGKALRGSLMSVDSAAPSTAIKAGPLRSSLLGVVSTTPGAVMDTDGGFHIGYGTKSEYKNEKTPIVLAGAAPVLVTSKNGPISIGDLIGISSVPGFGAKANTAGLTVGMALEAFTPGPAACKTAVSLDAIKWPDDNGKNSKKPCFKLPDGTYVGKIMAAVNVSWYDPAAETPDPDKELIKEMRSNIADLAAAVKAQQQEIRTLKQEISKTKK